MESGKAGPTGECRKTPIFFTKKHLSFLRSKETCRTSTPLAASKSYAAAVQVSTTIIATQTDLTWPNAEDKLKKISDLEKAKKQAAKAAQNQ